MDSIIQCINSILWGYVLIYGLLAVGVYFTIRLKFMQILRFNLFVESVLGSRESDRRGISPFQALCTSLASRVGTGNLAGVAVALYLGGPGAIFWMWLVALVGMATGYAESLLAQLYKVRDPSGHYRGGPAYYISKGLRAPWLGAAFALCLLLSFGLIFNAVQSNSIADAMETAFHTPTWTVGVGLVLLTALVIFGGLRSVARVSEVVVPFMAVGYLLVAVYVLATHLSEVPAMLALIVRSAFGLEQAAGGMVGYAMGQAMLNGVKRGLFSNEAGMGSAPNVAATATPDPHHPASQGFVQGLGPCIDTILICTATAVMILLSGQLQPGSGLSGVQLTQAAMSTYLGIFGNIFIAIAIMFFGFTSIVANYSYAENSIYFLKADRIGGIFILRLLCLTMVLWGTLSKLDVVWAAADASMGLMATFNLVGIVALSGVVVRLTNDYLNQRRAGLRPTFDPYKTPDVARGVDLGIWAPQQSAGGPGAKEQET
jgi:AGCS family alanine or glycine:cation symporter